MPRPVLEELARQELADLSRLETEDVVVFDPRVSGLPASARIPCPPEQYDLSRRLAAMDRTGVDLAALSAPPFMFCTTSEDERFTLDVVRRSNDALATFVQQAPERLLGLGTVPVGSPQAVAEARRCQEALGFAGLTIGTYGMGRELDDPVNEDLWSYLATEQTFVLLHPSRVSAPERLDRFHLPQLLGYPVETALAVSRLVFAGVLDRHDLQLCLAHGGGSLLSLKGRLDLGWNRKEIAHTTDRPPSTYLGQLYFDTALFDPTALTRLVADVGADRVLLGTDAPFDLEERNPLGLLEQADLSDAEMEALTGGNAARMLDLNRDVASLG